MLAGFEADGRAGLGLAFRFQHDDATYQPKGPRMVESHCANRSSYCGGRARLSLLDLLLARVRGEHAITGFRHLDVERQLGQEYGSGASGCVRRALARLLGSALEYWRLRAPTAAVEPLLSA